MVEGREDRCLLESSHGRTIALGRQPPTGRHANAPDVPADEMAPGEVVVHFYEKLEPVLELLEEYGAVSVPGIAAQVFADKGGELSLASR